MERKTKGGLVIVTGNYQREADAGERELECGICGALFRKHEMASYDRHVYRCANSEAAEVLEAQSPRRRFKFFDPELHGDLEYDVWVRRHREALARGQMKM